MSCPDANTLLAFVDGRLPEWEGEALELHLDRCEECRRVLASLASDPSSRSVPEPATRSAPDTIENAATMPSAPGSTLGPGDQLDQYKIERMLGRGGMGEVFLARDEQLRRRTAIKVIRPEMVGSADAVDRFLLEARAAARLNHPNIVTVYGVGECRGLRYIALEYVEGPTLRDRLGRSALPCSEWIPIARAVAEAAADAHSHGVVHGDLKPANVLLAKDGRTRTVDFGLARVVRDGSISLGMAGAEGGPAGVQGTPAYMAPELWQGQAATPASDVWALGVMLIELATGHVPLRPAQVARGQIDIDTVRDDMLRSSPALVPAALDGLLRCLELSAEARPGMSEIASALRSAEGASGSASNAARSVPAAADRSDAAAWHGARVARVVAVLVVLAGSAWGMTRIRGWHRMPDPSAPPTLASSSGPSVAPPVGSSSEPMVAPTQSSADTFGGGAPSSSATAHAPLPITADPARSTIARASGSAPSHPAPGPPVSSRLMALGSLEDQAEAADRRARSETDPGRKRIAEQQAASMRASADSHLSEVEVLAKRMQASEPANAASLLDYVRQGRDYLRKRRAAHTP